jgi:hypothetical protein
MKESYFDLRHMTGSYVHSSIPLALVDIPQMGAVSTAILTILSGIITLLIVYVSQDSLRLIA